jgi:23S rRNA (adenine2030-N6)-methyltransferase
MLSYQHGYHAGNMADVHKHALLAWMLAYLVRKDKPLSYLETHAGRAIYDLSGPEAVKTGEAAQGIAVANGWFAADHPYAEVLSKVRAAHGPEAYPGSPLLAATLLRPCDSMTLAELHPQEHAALQQAMSPYPATVVQTDGYAMALARTPPDPRRGFLLCDPSYEIKSDYQAIPGFLRHLHKRWPVGTLALWYPILVGTPHRPMLRALQAALPDAVRHEVAFPPARSGHRMTGSGLFVVNPPYGFSQQAAFLTACFARLAPQPDQV